MEIGEFGEVSFSLLPFLFVEARDSFIVGRSRDENC